jgi:hypothetical protein
MESKILGYLGKVAGIGGIAVGVVLLVFQGVLQKQFLPQAGLGSEQAFAVILSLMILTFGIGGIGVIAWLVGRTAGPKAPVPVPAMGMLAGLIVLVLGAAVYIGAQPKSDSRPSTKVEASGGGVAVGGSLSGSTINVGTTTGSDSQAKPK